MVYWFFINVQNVLYLHLIRNARSKNISSFEWYLLITARPNHFWCKNIRTTFFPWQNSTASPVYSFIMGIRVEFVINLTRYEIFSVQLCTLWLTIDVFYTLLRLIWCFFFHYKNIYTAHYFFLSTQPEVKLTRLFNKLFH